MRLPPGVSSKDFAAAMQHFEKVVGKDWVFTSDEDVDLYRDPYTPSWHEEEEKIPSAAVAPASVEEVQAVVKIANQYKIPLWPVSTGKNLGYGGSAPLLGGSVVLDLKRMNRVIEVNDKNHYALVEPGVSYFDLYRYIQDKGLKVWIDPPDPGWGSPVGNTLDRGGGRTPMHEHFAAECGMEVVLANGDVMRTGMGALPGAKTWQQYKYGFGPYIDGMFSQSNFGVVTKMGVWLMPEPEAYLAGTVMVPKHDDLVPLVDTLAHLKNLQILQSMIALGSPLLYYRASQGQSMLDVPGGPSIAEMDRLAQEKNLAYWSADLRFYGPAKVINAQWEYAKEKLSSIPGEIQGGHIVHVSIDRGAAGKGDELAGDRGPQLVCIRNPEERRARTHRLLTDHSHERRSRVRNAESFRTGIHGAGCGTQRPSLGLSHELFLKMLCSALHLFAPEERGAEPEEPAGLQAPVGSGWRAWLGRIPHACCLHVGRDERVFLQQPRAAALSRDSEGRDRSERDSCAGQERHLAETPEDDLSRSEEHTS